MPLSLEDPVVRRHAAEAVERRGWRALTLEQLASALGVSRVTLHRQGIGKQEILAALTEYIADEYRSALWPALTAPGNAHERLQLALAALCDLSERHIALLAELSDADVDAIFHEPGSEALSRDEITEGLARLLQDGLADGTLVVGESVQETATVLFNLIGWTYRHLRSGHRWSPEHAQRAVIEIALRGVSA
jgi:AcrR family transcriptional regulator